MRRWSEKKAISVRVNEVKYNKVMNHIKQMNATKYSWDRITFAEVVDIALDQYIKQYNL